MNLERPLLFGGFSFDQEKEKTDLWKEFDDTTFSLPAFLLTVKMKSMVNDEYIRFSNRLCRNSL